MPIVFDQKNRPTCCGIVLRQDWPRTYCVACGHIYQTKQIVEEIERRCAAIKQVPNAIELTGSPLAASPATGGSDVE